MTIHTQPIPFPGRRPNRSLMTDGDMIFESGKTYTHAQGLSCAFRQWRAQHSHCRFLHGYALQVTLTFRAANLDDNGWVFDFGGLKPIKAWLEDTFDHKLLLASDDPNFEYIRSLQELEIADIREVEHTGCEAFAKMIFEHVEEWISASNFSDRIYCECVEVREHEGNFARYRQDPTNG
jgi:6-pyruvoyltetrahydropterin/6-carboxytetrahydropterin synthase